MSSLPGRLHRSLTAAVIAFMPALPALGQASKQHHPNPIVSLLISWLPIVVLVVFWIWFIRRMGVSRYKSNLKRSMEHMERVEQQNVEILSTLRSIESELKDRRQ